MLKQAIADERLRRKQTEYHFATPHTPRSSAALNSAHSDAVPHAPQGAGN
jgi:hypothetical protein